MTDIAAQSAATATCRECGATLTGPYCQACGQPSVAVRRSFKETLLGQTGRLAHTLVQLVLRPGELAREIDEARDRRSMRPASLLLNLIAFFFIVGGGVGGFSASSIIHRDPSGTMERTAQALAQKKGLDRALLDERVEQRFRAAYSVLVPIVSSFAYAFMLWVVERRKGKAWLVHFAAAVQYLCATFLLAAVTFGAGRVLGLDVMSMPAVQVATLLLLAAYMVVMLVRLYADAAWLAVLKTIAVLAVGGVVDGFMAYAALAVAMISLL